MLPSEEQVAEFLTFAPDAGEGKAFVFLEVNRSVCWTCAVFQAVIMRVIGRLTLVPSKRALIR